MLRNILNINLRYFLTINIINRQKTSLQKD